MELSNKQKKYLKGLAHNLNPTVMVGHKGISSPVAKEIDASLENHELIKIKIRCEDQTELALVVEDITKNTNAALIQIIGHSVVLYRPSKDAKLRLP